MIYLFKEKIKMFFIAILRILTTNVFIIFITFVIDCVVTRHYILIIRRRTMKLLTTSELATLFSISKHTIRHYIDIDLLTPKERRDNGYFFR